MSISNKFQERIKDFVGECEVKKSDLPTLIGVDYRSLSNALNYGIVPIPRILIRIADYFDTSIEYLLGRSDIEYFVKSQQGSNFRTRFGMLCGEKGVTYCRVSHDLHFDNSNITRWLKRDYLPSLEFLDLICDYFAVSIDYLLGRTDEREVYE